MKLGDHVDVQKALAELFPGRETYLDNVEVVFADQENQDTQAVIDVPSDGVWVVEIFDDIDGVYEIEIKVPSARA